MYYTLYQLAWFFLIYSVAGWCVGVAAAAVRRHTFVNSGFLNLPLNPSYGFGAVLFAVFLLLFDVPTVLYSMLYMAVYAKIMDQTHFQNINVRLMIFTKKNGVDQDIMRKTARGVTEWRGVGAYTGEASNILVTVINKYEIDSFMHIIYTVDPNAFVIRDDGVAVSGNFERRV